jgi:hypothetical protein
MDVHYSPNITQVIKLKRMRWAGQGWSRGDMPSRVWWGNQREGDHLGDPGRDGRIILRCFFRKWVGGVMDWIDLAQDGDRCRALANAVMNLRVPQNARNFFD